MLKKTELIIFRRKAANIDYGTEFKLDVKTLTPVNTAKYLGILLDEHLQQSKQLDTYFNRGILLNRGIGILSKLRHNTTLKTLKFVYHSLFFIIQFVYHHLQYDAQLCSQANKES